VGAELDFAGWVWVAVWAVGSARDKEGVCDVAANADEIVTGCVLTNSASACGSKEAPAARFFWHG
jgi:hypothetical protein